ncbi:MAG: AAA family ATPase [Pseudomonadota bacterium]
MKYLDFEIPNPGVHLLAGVNGSGKTTLLGCLHRIGFSGAFATYFPKIYGNRFDDLSSAMITYSINGRSVFYRHAGERWAPLPRRNATLLADFGYPDVVYQGATAERITPAPDGLGRWLRPALKELRAALNRVFDTPKFDTLFYTNRTRGAGNRAFLLRVHPPPNAKYHTEKNFGLGELCVLNLIQKVLDCRNNSLVLIDEIEMALHAQAQIRFVQFLIDIAARKNLTILISTHSSTLIKAFGRKRLLFLHKNSAVARTTVVKECFAAFALGQIGEGEEREPDARFLLEDDAATSILETFVKLVLDRKYGADVVARPTIYYVPVGPFTSAIQLLDRGIFLSSEGAHLVAFLDSDVRDEHLPHRQRNPNDTISLAYNRVSQRVRFLPFVPEQQVYDYLLKNTNNAEAYIRNHFQNQIIVLPRNDLIEIDNLAGVERRRHCKVVIQSISEAIEAQSPNNKSSDIQRLLYKLAASNYFDEQSDEIMQLISPFV